MPLFATHPVRSRPSTAARGAAIVAVGLCVALAAPAVDSASAAPAPAATAAKIATVQRTLRALNMKIELTVEQYNSARLALSTAQRKSAVANANAERTYREYVGKRLMLSGFVNSAYRTGPDGSLEAMITSTPAEYLDRLSTLDEVSHRQAEIVTSVDAARQRYSDQVAAVQAAARSALQVTQHIATAKSSIETQIATQRGILAGLQAQQRQLAQLAARQQAANKTAAASSSRTLAGQVQAVSRSVTGSSRSAGPTSYPAPPASGRAAAAVAAARSVLGRPYVWGAAGPSSFDCSGFTMWSWAHAGVSLPHSSGAQYGSGAHVSKSALQPGDLLFFYSPISHVGMYIGGGLMIHAPHTGDVVRIATPQWGDFVGAVRPG